LPARHGAWHVGVSCAKKSPIAFGRHSWPMVGSVNATRTAKTATSAQRGSTTRRISSVSSVPYATSAISASGKSHGSIRRGP
jgi:hypothetical protein